MRSARDLRPVLDEEVGRLPEKYRLPIILCYLQGRTYAEASQELKCPRGTVAIRLQRGRDLLRGRLTRRGLALTAAATAVLAAEKTVSAALPSALVIRRSRRRAVRGGKSSRGRRLVTGSNLDSRSITHNVFLQNKNTGGRGAADGGDGNRRRLADDAVERRDSAADRRVRIMPRRTGRRPNRRKRKKSDS